MAQRIKFFKNEHEAKNFIIDEDIEDIVHQGMRSEMTPEQIDSVEGGASAILNILDQLTNNDEDAPIDYILIYNGESINLDEPDTEAESCTYDCEGEPEDMEWENGCWTCGICGKPQ